MGASIAEGGFDDDEEFAEAHEINVTPFIDVMLVLMIIFMVAAPLSTVDLPVDLPSSTAISLSLRKTWPFRLTDSVSGFLS